MAGTVKQGVEYEITANDKTAPAVDSAAERAEGAAKKTAETAKNVSKEFQGQFNPMSMAANALSGNIQGVGQQLLGLVSRMKGVHMSMMRFGMYAALVMAVAKGAQALVAHFRNAARQAEEIKLGNAERSLKASAEQSAALSKNIEEAGRNAERLTAHINAEIDAMERLAAAQNEFARAQELALANGEEERRAVEKRYEDYKRLNDEEASRARRAAKLDALDAEDERLDEASGNARDDLAAARDTLGEAQRRLAALKRRAANPGVGMIFGAMFGDDDTERQISRWSAIRDQAQKDAAAARDALAANERRRRDIAHEREMLGKEEAAENYEYAAREQQIWNEEMKEFDDRRRAEIEEVKEAAEKAAEEVKEARIAAEKEVKAVRIADIRETAAEEAEASRRLAAAQSAVRQAWGWYRDKNSLKAQLEEEKADAAAQAQFEKDFDKLRFRRDWREAKNLSLDQEAVRRVALAKEEESAAREWAKQTAEASLRAAEALENIEASLGEVG